MGLKNGLVTFSCLMSRDLQNERWLIFGTFTGYDKFEGHVLTCSWNELVEDEFNLIIGVSDKRQSLYWTYFDRLLF